MRKPAFNKFLLYMSFFLNLYQIAGGGGLFLAAFVTRNILLLFHIVFDLCFV